jgi:predicted unusual protein kinase regulating ubiquinone biosynthesis (AarF/ABC1/UbiB family)
VSSPSYWQPCSGLETSVHAADADLHPGNILVRVTDPNSLWGRVTNYFGITTSPKLILLDVGMTAELLPEDQQNLIDLFRVPPPPPP